MFHHLSPFPSMVATTLVGLGNGHSHDHEDEHSESSDRMVVGNQLVADMTVYSLGTQTKKVSQHCVVYLYGPFSFSSSSLQSSCHPRASSLSSTLHPLAIKQRRLLFCYWLVSSDKNKSKLNKDSMQSTWCGNRRRQISACVDVISINVNAHSSLSSNPHQIKKLPPFLKIHIDML